MSPSSDPSQLHLNDCGCCEGVAVETPVAISNRPGLSVIAYRVGTHSRFKTSMLATLSETSLPALRNLKTRDDNDFTIALLDAWALVSDVLTFYQERIANESYLGTATERRSVINLARLIGYELRPGVAAGTYLAFTLESGPGSPAAVTIDTGLQVQSIPGPDEQPQTFETIEQVEGRAEWNEMRPQLSQMELPVVGSVSVYFEGVATNLKKGDMLLFVGQERETDPVSERWGVRQVATVETDSENERTFVTWVEPLGSVTSRVEPGRQELKAYALRQHASLFGYNALEWEALPVALRVGEINPSPKADGTDKVLKGAYADSKGLWAKKPLAGTSINLDSVYSQIVTKSWVVLTKPDPAYAELYSVEAVGEESKVDFNMAAKSTRLEVSGENLGEFSPRNATVFAQSENLPIAETPITDPVEKDEIVLDQLIAPLAPGRTIVVTGKRPRARIEALTTALSLVSLDDPTVTKTLESGDELIVLESPAALATGATVQRWRLRDQSGFEGHAAVPADKIKLIAAAEEDAVVSEVATIKSTEAQDNTHSKLTLADPLRNVYDRATVTINANVNLATHGETVANEVLGSGDGSRAYQRFLLKQSPLTYTSADTASGGESTLEVRVNELKWSEVPTLFGHGARERIYITHTDDDKKTIVQFGDGVTGARLPMGQENVKATYRKGIGREGLLEAGQLSLLMTTPLGVQSVINPLATTGAQDPQNLADARTNSPLSVLTLDRIVSLRDYEDFTRSFSGIAKALATWTWNIHARGVFVTVAGIDGAEVDDKLQNTLISAMRKSGAAHVPVTIKSYRPVTFKVVADVKIKPDHVAANVLVAVEAALRSAFSFAARAFGQPVTLSEVMSVIQNVAGVVAVDVNALYRSKENSAGNSFLAAKAPQAGDDVNVPAAELLTLDPAPLGLGVMP